MKTYYKIVDSDGCHVDGDWDNYDNSFDILKNAIIEMERLETVYGMMDLSVVKVTERPVKIVRRR